MQNVNYQLQTDHQISLSSPFPRNFPPFCAFSYFLCKLSTLKSNECDRNVLQPRPCNANACFIVQAAAVPEIPDPEMEILESWGKIQPQFAPNTILMNMFHYFLPIFRLHRNMQVCLTCMYGRDTCPCWEGCWNTLESLGQLGQFGKVVAKI